MGLGILGALLIAVAFGLLFTANRPVTPQGFYAGDDGTQGRIQNGSEALGYSMAQFHRAGVAYWRANTGFTGVVPPAGLTALLPAPMAGLLGFQAQVVTAAGRTYVVTYSTGAPPARVDAQAVARGCLAGFAGIIAGVSDGANIVVGIPRPSGGNPYTVPINGVVPLPTAVPAGYPVAMTVVS